MSNTNLSEKKLLVQAQSGSSYAFEQLTLKHYQKVYNYALRICGGNGQLAADLAQDGFLKAFLKIKKMRADSSFSTWLWRIIYNSFIDYCRKESKCQIGLEEVAEEGSINQEDSLFQSETDKNLHLLISKVPSPFKDTLILIDILGHSYQETATISSVAVGTVRSRLARGRKELTKLVWKNRELFNR